MIPMSIQRQRGLSLVELMVAMALSLLLMLGVIQIFLSSKQTYSTNSALSRVQENGRFAMEFLTQDIRNTGYKGQCMGEPLNHGVANILWRLEDPIQGWNNITAKPAHLSGTPVNGTDAILIKFAAGPSEMNVSTGNTATDNTINLGANISGVAKHAITLVSDALSCDLFENAADSNATSVAKSAAPDWTHAYTNETEVLPLQNSTYYIRANNGRPNSLVRERLSTSTVAPAWITEELVEGVQDMQILYGIASADRQVSDYVTANNITNWSNVVAVRIDLLVSSADTNVVSEIQTITFNGTDVNISNRRLAQIFSSTIGIRNRLP
ncbi:PilW family protein [Stutzerimonas nitrititolerans]|uniref:PilW family protein n=1 Tax=Stutzerimonas nitrititolerans TaxID=2482751 RepID=UPI0028A60061|nr:PilW family protein [Stutzerimonas nitrititolerans]